MLKTHEAIPKNGSTHPVPSYPYKVDRVFTNARSSFVFFIMCQAASTVFSSKTAVRPQVVQPRFTASSSINVNCPDNLVCARRAGCLICIYCNAAVEQKTPTLLRYFAYGFNCNALEIVWQQVCIKDLILTYRCNVQTCMVVYGSRCSELCHCRMTQHRVSRLMACFRNAQSINSSMAQKVRD